jgi:hypothetical protein
MSPTVDPTFHRTPVDAMDGPSERLAHVGGSPDQRAGAARTCLAWRLDGALGVAHHQQGEEPSSRSSHAKPFRTDPGAKLLQSPPVRNMPAAGPVLVGMEYTTRLRRRRRWTCAPSGEVDSPPSALRRPSPPG